jgi:hypothetical protein
MKGSTPVEDEVWEKVGKSIYLDENGVLGEGVYNEDIGDYELTYYYDEEADTYSMEIAFDSTFGDLPTAVREGGVFEGWKVSAPLGWAALHGTTISDLPQYIDFLDLPGIILTVDFDNYITFDPNGGAVIYDPEDERFIKDEETGYVKIIQSELEELLKSEKSGNSFTGWVENLGDPHVLKRQDILDFDEPTTVIARYVPDFSNSKPPGGDGGGDPEPTPSSPWGKGPSIAEQEPGKHVWYVAGYDDLTFRADGDITREEFAMIIYRLLSPADFAKYSATTSTFSDVEHGRWSEAAIATLANSGLIYGYGNNDFRPTSPITRAEIATICARLGNGMLAGVQIIKEPYTDLTNDHWSYDAVIWVTERGWMRGVWDEAFCPEMNISRAMTVTVVNRILGRLGTDYSDMFRNYPDLSPSHWAYSMIQDASVTHAFDIVGDKEIWKEIAAVE